MGSLAFPKVTHRYKYVVRTPYPVGRCGTTHTGRVQVDRAYGPEELLTLIKQMSNGLLNTATLVSCEAC